ncbi:MAG: DUF6737 family protein [Synechococcaceae cyanobacterium ELA445]
MDPATAPATPQAEAASLWQLKPWWCQPWSILLTGVAVPLASWLLLHHWWITVPLGLAVLLWWWLFLVLVPASYRAERTQSGGDQNRSL